MIRELFHIGPISVSPFGVLLVAALFSAFLQLRWGMRKLGIGSEEDANSILLAAAIGGILGGKLYYAALYQDWGLLLSRSGIVFYGSFIGGGLAVIWMIRRCGLPLAATTDAVAPSVALGYAVGRVGCFLVGDDYGVPTNLPWGMTFPEGPIPTTAGDLARHFDVDLPEGLAPTDLVAVHPTQLYEVGLALGIWWLGRRLLGRTRVAGHLTYLIFSLLALERFTIEFLRAKDDRLLGPWTLAQGISVAIMALMLALWVRSGSGRTEEPLE